jgi:hypothetical protein
MSSGYVSSFRGAPLRREPGIQRSRRAAGFRVRQRVRAKRGPMTGSARPGMTAVVLTLCLIESGGR